MSISRAIASFRIRRPCAMWDVRSADSTSCCRNASLFWSAPDAGAAAETSDSGVPVTYSDINNAAMLIEVARQRGNYLPELSFGTHFFQDLVEASIRYLPLYPDDPTTVFNELFFRRSRNVLEEVLPEFAHLAETLRVTDVPLETGGLILRVLMNADLDQAVGFLSSPQQNIVSVESEAESIDRGTNEHWRWRFRMAQRIAADLDPQKFGVNAFYLIGSTKNATAGPPATSTSSCMFKGTKSRGKN